MPKQVNTGEVLKLKAKLKDEQTKLNSKFDEFQSLVHSVEVS
jgi:hypothetical protein